MKREALNSAETSLNIDATLPYTDNMLSERKTGFEQVNSMFGTNISVEFDSVWESSRLKEDIDTAQSEQADEPAQSKFSGIFKKKKKEVDTNEDKYQS